MGSDSSLWSAVAKRLLKLEPLGDVALCFRDTPDLDYRSFHDALNLLKSVSDSVCRVFSRDPLRAKPDGASGEHERG